MTSIRMAASDASADAASRSCHSRRYSASASSHFAQVLRPCCLLFWFFSCGAGGVDAAGRVPHTASQPGRVQVRAILTILSLCLSTSMIIVSNSRVADRAVSRANVTSPGF